MGINLPHIAVKPKQGDVGFETVDIAAFYWFHYMPDAIVVAAVGEFQSLEDLINHAKENPKQVIFSGSGSGSGKGKANHLVQIQFDAISDIETTYVSFKGTSASVTALMGKPVSAA